ncbi:hypothetical protein L7F22_010382 [Adiantum nelumboides]|nr:hypothetical protein [Adiantum nelumboides]
MPLIHALPPIFLAEVEATLPRPRGAQMMAGTALCGCDLSSFVQEGFVEETSFLVAMIVGSLVEVGARLTRKARYQRWFPVFDVLLSSLFCVGSSEPLQWLVAAIAEWWQLRWTIRLRVQKEKKLFCYFLQLCGVVSKKLRKDDGRPNTATGLHQHLHHHDHHHHHYHYHHHYHHFPRSLNADQLMGRIESEFTNMLVRLMQGGRSLYISPAWGAINGFTESLWDIKRCRLMVEFSSESTPAALDYTGAQLVAHIR